MIDHKLLLVKYIKHVIDCEGISFIPFDQGDRIRWASSDMTQEEIDELRALADLIEWE